MLIHDFLHSMAIIRGVYPIFSQTKNGGFSTARFGIWSANTWGIFADFANCKWWSKRENANENTTGAMVTKHKSASHDAMVLRSMVLAPLDFMEKTSAKPLFFGEKKRIWNIPWISLWFSTANSQWADWDGCKLQGATQGPREQGKRVQAIVKFSVGFPSWLHTNHSWSNILVVLGPKTHILYANRGRD